MTSAFKSPSATVTYHHDTWDKSSNMVFAQFRTQDDNDLINSSISETDFEYDPDEEKKARKEGKKYIPKITSKTKMSGVISLISNMARSWSGPDFYVPEDWTTDSGDPHPLRGQLAPCNAYWIGKMDAEVLSDIEDFLNDLYMPATEGQTGFFREPGSSVDGSTSVGSSEAEVPVPSASL